MNKFTFLVTAVFSLAAITVNAESITIRTCVYEDSGKLNSYVDTEYPDKKTAPAKSNNPRQIIISSSDICKQSIEPIDGYKEGILANSNQDNSTTCMMGTAGSAITCAQWRAQQENEAQKQTYNNTTYVKIFNTDDTATSTSVLQQTNKLIVDLDAEKKSVLEAKIVEIQKQIIELLKQLIVKMSASK